ncbi:hypothetical protein ACQBAR_16635 [Propionibacteriaceae bacterium Y1685]|uniref:hypothetical protein n=1 Tax=Microlunatus sp. Y1700 TaxID=3418487 RepID=UPI003B7BC914
MMKKTALPLLAAAGSTALLTLTGCASPDTFDFTQINGAPPAKELTIEIPDELLEMDSEYAESRVLESVTVKSVDLGDPKWCAVEADFDYADGINDRIRNTRMTDTGDGPGGDYPLEAKFSEALGLSGGNTPVFGEPDKANLEESVFMSEDGETVVHVMDCAASPTDDDEYFMFDFNSVNDVKGLLKTDTFAEIKVVVMKSGEVSVLESEVDGYMIDANGSWIAK